MGFCASENMLYYINFLLLLICIYVYVRILHIRISKPSGGKREENNKAVSELRKSLGNSVSLGKIRCSRLICYFE